MTTAIADATVRPRGALNVALWLAQAVLALAFGMAGIMKTTMPMAELAHSMVWPGQLPAALVRFIGLSELVGAVGLVLPAVTRIKPILTALAAVGLLLIMVLASVFHITRGEFQALPFNLGLGALAAFIAWGRFRKVPIPSRA